MTETTSEPDGPVLPVPLEVEVPNDSWVRVDPESRGLHNAAALIVRTGLEGPYEPTIAISGGVRGDDARLEAIADEEVALFNARSSRCDVAGRTIPDGAQPPTLVQYLRCSAVVAGEERDMRVIQAIQSFQAQDGTERQGIVIHTATGTADQLGILKEEFEKYLANLSIASPTDGTAGGDRTGDDSTP